jgi:ABC-2 type transport system ATP-binding protein
VLVSSHLLAELALAADAVVIIKDGRLVTQGPVGQITGGSAQVRVRSPQAGKLRDVLVARGVAATLDGSDQVVASGVDTEVVGRAVAEAGLVVYEMSAHRPALEEAFLALTTDDGSRR